ncbi:MAG: hypothetical protein COB01_01520 [Lutibacter sp.]|nr:MAG: hypothetical protein COB01_01520 [Lutibacter sp.]
MKITFKLFLLSFSIAFFISCQNEINSLTQLTEDNVLLEDSTIATLLSRTVSKDGSHDNIIDNASCITINLPVTLLANGITLIIENENGLSLIEEIFDNLDDDIDTLEIVFPIVITLSDYTEITINSIAELDNFASECEGENEPDFDIECVDFIYPINLSIYDEGNQLIETVVIENDMHFFGFINHLGDGHVSSINFPINMRLFDGTEITINTMEELGALIEEAEFMCDEDDNYDYNDDDCMHCSEDQVADLLLTCSWNVTKLIINDIDYSENYTNYTFTFSEDGTVKVMISGEYVYGTWELTTSQYNMMGGMGGYQHAGEYLDINFEDLPDFSFSWRVYEIENDEIDLRLEHNRLKLEKEC